MNKLDEWLDKYRHKLNLVEASDLREAFASDIAEALKPSHNTGSPKFSGAVCRWCYGHKDMCEKCVFGSEFSPAAQHRASA